MLSSFQSKKINILFIIMQMEMGGSERLVHSLVRNIDRTRFSPAVAWFFGSTPLAEYLQLEVPLFHIPKAKRVDLNTLNMLADIMRKHRIEVVNAHHFMSMVYGSWGCIRNGARMLYTEHSSWEIEKIDRKWKVAGRQLLKRAHGAIGVSEAVSGTLRRIFRLPADNVHTIPNGVDLGVFSRRGDPELVRQELGLKAHHVVIGMVANFKKVKNHFFLLRAFKALSRTNDNIRLILIGKGVPDNGTPTEKDIREYVAAKGLQERVLMLGFRADVARLLGAIDIFCLTSLKEGLPIGLIEAMAAGCPVVGTNVEGIRDVIVPELNGLMVPLGETDALCNALERLVQDKILRTKMGQAARDFAVRHFSMDACINAHENLFHSAFASRALNPIYACRGKSW